MTRMQARIVSALAALPFSFLAIPYVYWRSRQTPWLTVLLKPLLIIFAAWMVVLFLPVPMVWILCFGLIIWVSLSLKDQILAAQPLNVPDEPWRR